MSAVSSTPPIWDLSSYFNGPASPEFIAYRDDLKASVTKALARAEALGQNGKPITAANSAEWAAFLVEFESIMARLRHIGSYLGCLSAADTVDETIKKERANLSPLGAQMQKVRVAVRASFKNTDQKTFDALLADKSLSGAEFTLKREREEATYAMAPELEGLAADLGVDGLSAWGRLYDQVAGKLEFDMTMPDGSTKRVPMSQKVSLLEDADPAVRRAAFIGSNKAWSEMEDIAASTLNAIAGTRLSLYKRRGIKHFLDAALFDSCITRKTLDTMMDVMAQRRETPRKYLRLKAKLLGKKKLPFYDLTAPLPVKTNQEMPWPQGVDRVVNSFGKFFQDMGDFAKHTVDKKWIDAQPRANRRPGAFCTSSPVSRESRVFMTFRDTVGDVQTLAHELGHAYHNWLMRDMRLYARDYPMTLAETASTFAENVVTDTVLNDPQTDNATKAVILDTRLADAGVYLLNIPMRFIFEKSFYEERANGEVPVSRIKELVLQAQRECWGDTLDENEMDPYFWASKLHFYITGVSFYNFPYSFGYLFSGGVFARAKKEGPGFFNKYRDLLRLTGSDTAENVAKRAMGVDLEKPEFWNASIDLVEEDWARYEPLVKTVLTD